jgi:hypothetical protein
MPCHQLPAVLLFSYKALFLTHAMALLLLLLLLLLLSPGYIWIRKDRCTGDGPFGMYRTNPWTPLM